MSYDVIDVFAEKGKLVLTDGKLSTKFEKGGQVTVQLYVDPASSERMLKAEGKIVKGSPIPPSQTHWRLDLRKMMVPAALPSCRTLQLRQFFR